MGIMDFLQRRIHVPTRDEWPPKDVKEHWEKVGLWRRRYQNDRDELLMYNPEWNHSVDRAELYTPVPMAREMARLSSSLLFSAPPVITHSTYEAEIEELMKINGLEAFLQETGEYVATEGRGAFRVGYHPDVADGEMPNITFVHEDQVIWHRYDRFMVGGTVVIEHEEEGGNVVWRLLEEHGKGWIHRRLYKGAEGRLGDQVAFSEKAVEELFPDYVDMPEYVETGLDVPCLIEWSNVPGAASDIAGLELYLDRLDEAESLLLDKGRKSVPVTFADESMVEDMGTSLSFAGVVFLKSAGYLPADGNPYVETVQPVFDVASHLEWIRHIRESILMMAGYSIASWGMDDGGQASGKALKLRQARTLLHKAGKDRMAIEAIKTALAVALAYQHNSKTIEEYKPEIVLGDGMPEDPIENAQQIQLEDSVGAISHAEKIRVIRPWWTEERVQEEVEEKQKEDEEAATMQTEMEMQTIKANADARAAATPGTQPKANGQNPKPRGVSGDSTSGTARKDQR
jgi:hypothetical protein